MYNVLVAFQEEVEKRIYRAMAGVPWVLRHETSERLATPENVSTDEVVHGVQLLVMELARIVVELAGEIDKLRATE